MLINISRLGSFDILLKDGGRLSPPSAFGWNPPFEIRRTKGVYTTDFNIDAQRPTPAVTYYVDPVAGLDANDGLTESTPKLNFSSAITTANSGGVTARFRLKPGVYRAARTWNNTALNISAIIEPWADDPTLQASRIKFVGRSTTTPLAWNAFDGETYVRSTTAASDPVHLIDLSFYDTYGSLLRYEKAASLVDCQARRGTWWRDTGTQALYVHSADGRNLVGDPNVDQPTFNTRGYWNPTTTGAVLWMQNIAFIGGTDASFTANAATGISAKLYSKNCIFQAATGTAGNGLEVNSLNNNVNIESYSVNCVASWNVADGFNYHSGGTASNVRMVEISCKTGPNGFVNNGINNATTLHEDVRGISINGNYAGSQNRVMHDVNASRRWALGCIIGASQASDITAVTVAAGSADTGHTVQTWLDGCTLANSATAAIYAYAGCAIRYKNMNVSGLTVAGSGTVEAYN